MNQTLLLTAAACVWIALGACAYSPAQPVSPLRPVADEPAATTPTSTPATAAPEESPTPTPAAEAAAAPEETATMAARTFVAQETGVELEQVTVVSAEAVEWPDACLGVYHPEEMCAAVITPGFLVIVETPNGQVEVHTDAEGRSVRIAPAPAASAGS